MAYFAIVRDSHDDDFQVIACHINLWSLSASFKRRIFLWDVGLRLEAGDKEVSKICLALPVGTYDKDAEGVEDLSDLMNDRKAAELIFGKPVTITDSTISYTSTGSEGEALITKIKASPIVIGETILNEHLSGRDFSFWTLKLGTPLKKGTSDMYLRVRFRVRNLGRVWTWKKSSMVRNGALVDLRITDIRGSFVDRRDWRSFSDRISPITQLSVFVIAPAWLQLRAVSPDYHYMRLFEGRVWEPYLKRMVDLKRREKLTVYQWRNSKPVDSNNSYHVMLDLSREFGLLDIKNHLLTATLVLIYLLVAAVAVHYFPNYQNDLEALAKWVVSKVLSLTFISVATVVALVSWQLYRHKERFEKSTKFLRNWLLGLEQRRYRKNLLN